MLTGFAWIVASASSVNWPEGEVVDEAAQRAEQARLYSLAVLSRLSERSRSVLILKAGLVLSYSRWEETALGGPLLDRIMLLGKVPLATLHGAMMRRLLGIPEVWITTRDDQGFSALACMAAYAELDRWRDNFNTGEIWMNVAEAQLATSE